MTALAPGMCTQDATYDYSDTKSSIHPVNHLQMISVSLWKLASELEDHPASRGDIKELQELAQELDDYSRDYDCREEQQMKTQLRNGG